MTTTAKIIIITAPSGSGKSTLIKRLMQVIPELAFSISACTRNPRGSEQDGVDYHFISTETFQKHIQNEDFIEWEMVYEGKYYGTLKSEFDRIWRMQKLPLVDIDVQGAINVQAKYPNNTLSIFIQAPSIAELERRLINRNTDNPESIQERLRKAAEELTYAHHFNHVIINDDLEVATQQLLECVQSFITSERH